MQVPVAQVVLDRLPVPLQLAGASIEHHKAVGVQVVAGAAGAVREFRRSRPRTGVRDAEIDVALVIDRRGGPQTATRVDFRVAPKVVGRGVERPLLLTGRKVERVYNSLTPAAVEVGERCARNGTDDDGVIPDKGGHVHTLAALPGQLLLPLDLAGGSIEGDNAGRRRGDNEPATDRDSIRARGGIIQRASPLLLTCRAINREDVRVDVLQVDGIARDDGVGREDAERALTSERHAPRLGQCCDVGGVDLSTNSAGVAQVPIRSSEPRGRA